MSLPAGARAAGPRDAGHRDAGHRDAGSALLIVLVTMTIVVGIVTVGLQHALGAMRQIDRATDTKQALVAAEAGVDDYLARLHRDDGYWRDADCDNRALAGDPATTGTVSDCGWNATTPLGWSLVPGSPDAFYHYDVDVTDTPVDGTITLTSTGQVREATRTIEVVLRRGGFGEFLYYTVFETIDPADEATYGLNNTTAESRCRRYLWATVGSETRVGRSPARTLPSQYGGSDRYCSIIRFVTGDRINGPMHTNDIMVSEGSPRFTGTVTTSYPGCDAGEDGQPRPASACYGRLGSGNAVFSRGIGYREEIELPPSIVDLRALVTPGQVPAERLGCRYTGPTRIRLLPPTSGTQQMKVWSKYSQGTLNPGCGISGTGTGQLGNKFGATVALPHNRIVLVRNVPQAQSSPSTGACPTWRENGSGFEGIGDGLPVAEDYNATLRESDCRYGTLYVQGQLKGRVTMAAENNIVVTGDLTYAGGAGGTDALGLIAENSVDIYHPVKRVCTRREGNNCTRYDFDNLAYRGEILDDVRMHAAVQTLQHSFGVQSYQLGERLGTLEVFGSLAQRFRGPVGTGGGDDRTGYLKDYTYDSRLRFAPPPYFLDPVQSGWGQKVFGEVQARY